MTTREAIRALNQRGYSQRKIARELGIHRKTVGRYLAPAESAESAEPPDGPKCTTLSPGSEARKTGCGQGPKGSKCTTPSPGSEAVEGPGSPAPGTGQRSACEPYREFIEGKLAEGLHGKRIWQDLVDERGYQHGYPSVKRFVRKLKAREPQRVWRLECLPGEEAQIDYGTLWVRVGGKRRKIHVLRVTLSHSRKGYTEAMPRQDTESFVRGIENALRHFGGVPRLLVLDNLKAGVLKPDYYDPELNPKFAAFCEHYEVTALPTRPRTPEHKGKVESNIRYVKESALKGREFDALGALNAHLREWERGVADKRIHGTTRKQVGAHFAEAEKPALKVLPPDLFPSFVEAKRRVHRDSYIEFEKAYYEVPAEYIGRELWVRGDGRMVQIFNLRMEQVAVHVKLEAGQFTKVLGCGGVPASVEQSLRHWRRRAAEVGPDTGLWAKGLVERRGAAAMRVLMGLIHKLLPRHGKERVERACGQARLHGQYRLRELQDWLERPGEQQAFSFLSEHEVIREMDDYGRIVGFEQGN
jgi:transposase